MQIEAGKYYRTREGRKAFVEHVLQHNPFGQKSHDGFPALGYIEGKRGIEDWKLDGHWTEQDNCNDLIAEYIEPPTALELAKYCKTHVLDFVVSESAHDGLEEMCRAIIAASK